VILGDSGENDDMQWDFGVPVTIKNNIYTLWIFNIAMENGPFIDGLSIKNGDFPWLC
jgi:hypothetical protein